MNRRREMKEESRPITDPVMTSCQKIRSGSSLEIDQLLDDLEDEAGVEREGLDGEQQQPAGQQPAQQPQDQPLEQEGGLDVPVGGARPAAGC